MNHQGGDVKGPGGIQWVMIGRVVSGAGQAANFTGLDWVQEQMSRELGFRPAPGTLNVAVPPSAIPAVEALRREPGIVLYPPDPSFCTARMLPVWIESVPGALMIPPDDVNIHEKSIIEVLAPVRLKKELSLQDGDPVRISVRRTEG